MNEELNPDVQNAPDVLESPVVVEAEAEMPNYSEMSLAELSQLFEELAASEDRMKRSKEADAIKAAFYKRLSKERSATLGVEEISGRYLEEAAPHVGNAYTISYDEKEKCSSIVPGYFGRNLSDL